MDMDTNARIVGRSACAYCLGLRAHNHILGDDAGFSAGGGSNRSRHLFEVPSSRSRRVELFCQFTRS